jgi:quercetin dioxygenase-like cupin family protein
MIMTESKKQKQEKPQQELLTQLVEFQAGSVVSRVLLKETNGSVTVFAFSAGEELSPHATPFSALLFVLEGKVEVMIGENKKIMSSGEIITLPKNIIHAIKAISDVKMLLIMVK